MNNNILIDIINIKTLPEDIVNYLRENNVKTKLNSVRNIYSIILREISYDVESSYLNRIQKYLSSTEASNILIFDDINDNIYDKELRAATDKITDEINKVKNQNLYTRLIDGTYFIHFEDDERLKIEKAFKEKNYYDFMFYLFKHAFRRYKINTPKILAQRLFDEAITLENGTSLAKNLFKVAADLGHTNAAIFYGNLCSIQDECVAYYLKAKDLNSGLWKVAWKVEHERISEKMLYEVKRELKDILTYSKNSEECNVIVPKDVSNFKKDCLITSYRLYYYLAAEKNFSKAYNSLGKFLINSFVVFTKKKEIDYDRTLNTGIKYLKQAISLSNVHAMQNLSIYYKKNNINMDTVKPLLQIGADYEDLIACVELSDTLMKEKKLDEAITYLKFAANQKSAYAQHNIGKFYENKFNYEDAIYWYKESIKNGDTSTAIDLALIYFQQFFEKNNKVYLLSAITLLKNHNQDFSESDRIKAEELIKKFEELEK